MTPTDGLAASPELYPLAVDLTADAVRFVRLTEADYRAASFLDSRMTAADQPGEWRPWGDVRATAARLPRRCHFLFHISHVGSTLVSRLAGEHKAVFAVREPAVLRLLAEAHLAVGRPGCPWDRAEFDARTAAFLGLWSRTYTPVQTAVIKATSFVSEMAEYLLDAVGGAKAVAMSVPPPTYLPALLGGAMGDIDGAAEVRLWRLHRRLGGPRWRLADLSPGERVAMSWLCEMTALCAAAARFPDRVLWLDFDHYLADPAGGLTAVFRHLGVEPDARFVAAVLAGPIPAGYAKAPTQRYDTTTRDALLEQATRAHAAEIRRGLDWLAAAAQSPDVLRVLETAARHTESA